uniref:Perilipin n=1 Tax=Varanus komodoensis TaxID=61221 RepID=A0A8D2LSS6_VARKO
IPLRGLPSFTLNVSSNIVTRVASLPLISSAYSMCSAFYTHAKETHPHLNTACSVVELVAAVAPKALTYACFCLVATMNESACKKLDKLEETLPCLHQQTPSLPSTPARRSRPSGLSFQALSVHPFAVELAAEVRGGSPVSVTEQQQLQSYFVRLGSLSSKVRQRAYLHSLKKLRLVKENTQNTLSQLQLVISLVEHLKHGVGQRFQDAQEKLNNILREWLQTQPGERQSAGEDLHTSFSSAGSIQDLTSSILAQSNEKIADAHEALDSLVDHVVQNTPLNWVVGPFRARDCSPLITEPTVLPSKALFCFFAARSGVPEHVAFHL